MIKIEIPPRKRSYALPVTLVASVLFHMVLWSVLTEFGKRPVSESYLVQLVMRQKELMPTPEPEKPKPDLKKLLAEATPPPIKEQDLQQLLQQKTIEQQLKAEFKIERQDRTHQEITSLTTSFNRRAAGDGSSPDIPSLVNVGGRGSGDPGPPATKIMIGSGRKGGIGISSDGVGTIGINIGSGYGGGRGHGRGSGTGGGADVPTLRYGGVGFGNGRGGGGGGGGSGPNIGNIGSAGGRRAKAEAAPTVAVQPISKKSAAAVKDNVSGEWVVAAIAGPIAGLQIKCYNNPGIHIYENIRIQCDNNQIVAAWRRM